MFCHSMITLIGDQIRTRPDSQFKQHALIAVYEARASAAFYLQIFATKRRCDRP